jgi:Flp pilus assembly pilin Flp
MCWIGEKMKAMKGMKGMKYNEGRLVIHHPSSVIRNEAGVTAVEFALIAPVFMLIVAGIIEISLIMFTATVMESATNITSRVGKTGYIAVGKTRQQQIIDTVNAKTAGFLNPAKITVTSEVYSDFDDVGQPEPCISPPSAPCSGVAGINFMDINGNGSWDADMAAAGLGNAGDVVVYKISYPWSVTTPIISSIIGKLYTITARSVIRNEPFGLGVGR